ncbi:hypothetical protein NP493_820g01008 [Ridgeia piscesae]|uniref:Nucleolar complex protein 2 homolog n=1 Tax=Ridgeia piscesae TaxID=27915 RepID=A0AAD9KMS7_RIDPI|nr:hypothetical protein NP493_820g01008 [Ridgeia piscesae]
MLRKSQASKNATEFLADGLDSSSEGETGPASTKHVAKKSKKKKSLGSMSATEFMAGGLDSSSDEERASTNGGTSTKDITAKTQKKGKEKMTAVSTMKSSMSRLQQQDPEFYEFLKKEDKELLDFDASDDGSDDDGDSDDDGMHKLPAKLAVASDESETEEEMEEEEEEKKVQKKAKKEPRVSVTMKLVKKWSTLLREKSSLGAVHKAVSAFKAAVQETSTESTEHGKYRVEGSQVFNAVVRLCITDLLPAVNRLLKLPEQNSSQKKPVQPSGSKMWTKVRIDLKSYLQDLMQLMSQLAEPTVLNVILRHVHQMVPFYVCFPRLTQLLLKKVIGLWSAASEETTRVLAFLCISRLLHVTQNRILETCIKQMYMAYVRNCKFTSPSMLPVINFMQKSMVEVLALNPTLTYQYAFIYIRQLAIHLRSAITVRKPEVQQTVYNWQYIHSLHLWVRMLSQLHPNPTLDPLIYPLTQVIIGAIKLIPTARYYPLRFHCVKALNILSRATNTFIPVLPFLTEVLEVLSCGWRCCHVTVGGGMWLEVLSCDCHVTVLEVTDFNKKHKKMSLKPISFACILKLSKPQLEEKGFKDVVIDQLYEHLMDCFEIHAHTIGFPELALPALLQMKKFTKNCKVANYTKQIKQIVDKVTETSKVITQRRKTASLDLANTKAVEAWERKSREEGTPLGKYYTSWRKLRDRELLLELGGKEKTLSKDELNVKSKPEREMIATAQERMEFSELFDLDSDEEDGQKKTKSSKKTDKSKKKEKVEAPATNDSSDEYSDFNEDELAVLAGSADEDDSDDEDDDEGDEEDQEEEMMEGEDGDMSDKEDVVEDFVMSSEED